MSWMIMFMFAMAQVPGCGSMMSAMISPTSPGV